MFKKIKKLGKNVKGFTLTEVLIGMMILSIAIVTGTNLLVSLIDSNKTAVSTMQAYYLAQEGLEAVRNMRDTNWLHNRDWLDGEIYDMSDGEFAVDINPRALSNPADETNSENRIEVNGQMVQLRTWDIGGNGDIGKYEVEEYWGPLGIGSKDSDFNRKIKIEDYDCGLEVSTADSDPCSNFKLVRSIVTWEEGERSYELSTVLTNWQGTAL
ncbi:prepilin-type N-terminal cleavage/methylation domain-containing protein [Patescibacteria group bacterium]